MLWYALEPLFSHRYHQQAPFPCLNPVAAAAAGLLPAGGVGRPLMVIVSRLTQQKGLSLMLHGIKVSWLPYAREDSTLDLLNGWTLRWRVRLMQHIVLGPCDLVAWIHIDNPDTSCCPDPAAGGAVSRGAGGGAGQCE